MASKPCPRFMRTEKIIIKYADNLENHPAKLITNINQHSIPGSAWTDRGSNNTLRLQQLWLLNVMNWLPLASCAQNNSSGCVT